MQKKTFTKWVNSHLARVTCRVGDLYSDLRDGRNLLRLLEVLSGETLVSRGRQVGGSLRNWSRGQASGVSPESDTSEPKAGAASRWEGGLAPRGFAAWIRRALLRGDGNSGPIENLSFPTHSGCS